MQTTVKPAMTVLSHKVKTNLKEINKHLSVPEALYKEAVECGMRITGCNYWIYSDCTGDLNADFALEMVLPVHTNGQSAKKFELKKLPAIKCVTYLHQGGWEEFKNIYPCLMQEIMSRGMKPGKVNREMYINCDFEQPENCITEIQIEIN